MSKVTFDGENKLIRINDGITYINVQKDIYSEWKRWIIDPNNKKYLRAIRVVGGEPLPVNSLGSTFFLMNGWKIKPYEGDHRLIIDGNIYAEDGSDPIRDTDGDYKVTVMMKVSNLIDKVDLNMSNIGSGSIGQCNTDNLDIITEDGWTMTVS